MQRSHWLIPIPALLLVACHDHGPALTPVTPWLAASATAHDFGELPHGKKASHAFRIGNTSTQRVRLRHVRNQCTCAVASLKVLRDGKPVEREIWDPPARRDGDFLVTWLEPGEELEVLVTVDTKLRPPGDHKEPAMSELSFQPVEAGTVTISYEFRIRGRVRVLGQLGAAIAPYVNLGDFSKDQEVLGVLEVAPRDGKTFRVLGVDGTDDRLSLEPIEALEPGGFRWLVRLSPDGKPGSVRRQLEIRTDLDGGYTLPIGVEGTAQPNLMFVPSARLDFHRFDLAQPRRSFVTVIYQKPGTDPQFRIGRLEVKDREDKNVSELFEARVQGGDGRRWELGLSYKGGCQSLSFEGWVELLSADPEHPSTLVRFTGFHGEPR